MWTPVFEMADNSVCRYQPYTIWSLYAMLKVSADAFYRAVTMIEQIQNLFLLQGKDVRPSEKDADELVQRLELIKSHTDQLSLPMTRVWIDKIELRAYQDWITYGELVAEINELHHRFIDELETRLLFHVPWEIACYYTEPLNQMGAEVLKMFPDIVHDLEEAGKSLALDRSTACVFHLMRIMEAGLRHLCTEAQSFGISIPDPASNRSWAGWLDPIEKEIRKDRNVKSGDWNAIEPLYAQVCAHLRTVSTAWRNPTMHVGQKYTPEESRDIFNATKSFMIHLATTSLKKPI